VSRGGDPVGLPAPGLAEADPWVMLSTAATQLPLPPPGKLLRAPLKVDDFWGFTPGFSRGAPPSEGPRGRVRPRQCTTPTVLRTYSHTQTRSTRQIRRACRGTRQSGCVNTPLFDPFAGTSLGRDQVWGGQHACLTPGWRQSRHRAAYWLCRGRGKSSDWPHTTGNPAHGVRNGASRVEILCRFERARGWGTSGRRL